MDTDLERLLKAWDSFINSPSEQAEGHRKLYEDDLLRVAEARKIRPHHWIALSSARTSAGNGLMIQSSPVI